MVNDKTQNYHIMQDSILIPTEFIQQVLEKTSGVRPSLKDELSYLRTSLAYLREGMNVDQAIDLATMDYLMSM